jgi:CheY-like chemotaxis protein
VAFYQEIPAEISALRNRFSEISRPANHAARQKNLQDLRDDVRALKTRLGVLELLPAWRMAAGLEGLLEPLAEKPSELTPSLLRTAAGALVSLEALCVPGVRSDLDTDPAIRFLVVDDDHISRRTVAFALQKFTQSLDVAENGETALEFAARQAYDIVFLDVEMPGIDGFEVCSRIHETEANRATPVVFVTSHSDFESREKSSSSGGRDFIAKPFRSFEVTVKALTLVLRARLDKDKQAPKPSAAVVPNDLACATAVL